ncbi:MAG: 2-hydroxychromene-2-carboxylate isomerase [Rhodospirillaceae bacterium]|nr:2-hydroxychromene-2-carboxylate isomerase [Rhodospirillaceae bacterium]
MTKSIPYYFSLNSPWTYLGDARFTEMTARHGFTIDYKPTSLGKVFPTTGGLPLPKRAPARQAYRFQELVRGRDHVGIPLNLEPAFFPADEWPVAGMVIAAKGHDQGAGPMVNGILTAVWAEERNIADRDTLLTIAGERGYDGAALMVAGDTDEAKAEFDQNADDALACGVFGAPSYVIGEQVFWGQDRLDFVERALAGA